MPLIQIQEPDSSDKNEEKNQNEIVIGIDLGTTNSLVGAMINGRVELFKNEFGSDLHPSVIAFNKNGSLESLCSEGSAVNKIRLSSIKRLIGKSFPDIEKTENFPYKFDEKTDEKSPVKIIIGSASYNAVELSSMILSYLKKIAEKQLGIKVKKAVITVPAYFNDVEKNATKLAANLAGLEVLRLLNEPTAAALAYGFSNESEGIYAVYDLGGGTFDVSILKIKKSVFKVLGVSGDRSLGGDDFDYAIFEKIKKEFFEKAKLTDQDIFQLKAFAKKIKEKLSDTNSIELELSMLGKVFNIFLSREDFEKLIEEKINKTINLTKNLIDELELASVDIKAVMLVGGSSRIPRIKEKLLGIFTEEKIFTNIDEDRAVAIGAVLQAHNLSGNNKNLLLDVNPLSLGIEMIGGEVEKIILRNTTVPTAFTKEFTTYAKNQTGMKLRVVQGESRFANDCRSLAEFEIKNIPMMDAGMARVAITFILDADGLLTVIAEEKSTKIKQEIVVNSSYQMDAKEIKKILMKQTRKIKNQ
jgi:molecular chaperone HscA